MPQYNIDSITKNSTGFGLPFPDKVYSAALAADTDTSLTVPGGSSIGKPMNDINKFIAVFSYENPADTFVRLNATADQPAGAAFAANASELAPLGRFCKTGDVIHMRSVAGADVTVSFYPV